MSYYLRIIFLISVSVFTLTALTANLAAQDEACCYPDGLCETIDPQICINQGGTPLGPGTVCSDVYGACCFDDGSCEELDSLCCIENGGVRFTADLACAHTDCSDTCEYLRNNDYNEDGMFNMGDIVYLQSLITSGARPGDPRNFDANGDCIVTPFDLEMLSCWHSTGWLLCRPDYCTCLDAFWYADTCDHEYPGDVDNDGDIDINDAVFLTAWLYQGGMAPPVLANADPNGDCCADSNDIVYITDYLFLGGPDPVACTCWDIAPCPDTCDGQYPGDFNNDGTIDMNDVSALLNWIYKDGVPPPVLANADPNGDCCADTADVVYLTTYIFWGGPAPVSCTCVDIDICDSCHYQYPGDVNNNGIIEIADATYLINWLYSGGPEPPIPANADPNGDCCADSNDVNYITDYLILGGPPPVTCTCVDIEPCDSCHDQYPGDINGDGSIDVSDMTMLIDFLVNGGISPGPNADVNGDCWIEYCDAYYLRDYLFNGGPAPVACTCENPEVCDCNIGDANHDGGINVGDAVYMIQFIFAGGPPPGPYYYCNADSYPDCTPNIADPVAIINYVFKGGPGPICCHDWIDPVDGCGPPLR
ncbi:MAG: dockerin type I repeat-containing protein [Candidatus Zixiibacteriota bacterium]